MLYIKVKKEYDNTRLYIKRSGYYEQDGILIGGELFTVKEFEKMHKKYCNLKSCFFEYVNISKFDTYIFFGARFERNGTQ